MMYKVYNRSDARCQCCSSGFILGNISVLEKKCNPIVSLLLASLSCRYQYYLQLKKDVLEGRISCSLEQAIRLASLAVQGTLN